jgi:predicted NACHT family NTPase
MDDRADSMSEMRERPGTGRRLSALAQLDRNHRLVLLGNPGSGRSTFVHFVALCLAGEVLETEVANLARLTEPLPQDDEDRREKDKEPQPQPWSHGPLLPVRIVLRDFAAKHLWDFIAAELESAAPVDFEKPLAQELLKEGGLLLLDGLDEVPEANRRREQIKQVVEDFSKSFPRCRVLVTSRTYAYQQQAWRLPSFAEAVLAPFGSGQIRRFVERWYTHSPNCAACTSTTPRAAPNCSNEPSLAATGCAP